MTHAAEPRLPSANEFSPAQVELKQLLQVVEGHGGTVWQALAEETVAVFSAHDDGEIAHLAAGEIEFVEQTAVFIDDGVGPEARPLDVVFLVVGELFRLL